MLLEKLVCNSLNPFVKGIQILDSVLIVNECLDSRLKSSLLGGLCKLSLEKDYDHMHWSFVIYMLRQLPSTKSNRSQVRFRESTSPEKRKGYGCLT